MNEIEFSALMVSRVCHDLVGPLGAVVNGLEVLEDERDAAMRDDAIRLVASSANQALARIQFMRIAFGAAGSAGAELDLGEVGRLVQGLLEGGKVKLEWNVPQTYWAKDWAKLLMNSALLESSTCSFVRSSVTAAQKPSISLTGCIHRPPISPSRCPPMSGKAPSCVPIRYARSPAVTYGRVPFRP